MGGAEEVLKLAEVKVIVEDYSLLSLVDNSLTMLGGQLLTTFVERWHKETSFFHLPFGEMTITFDDGSYLLHIPLAGSFFTGLSISQDLACMIVVQNLGITNEQVIKEFRFNRGAHFRLSWLRDRYDDLVHHGMYEETAKVNM